MTDFLIDFEHSPTTPQKPELLLPAGDFDSVKAAVQNGADAVYLGGRDFSARQNAANFDRQELIHAVQYCHARGVKVYQTLNTLVFDTQLSELTSMLRAACEAGVDAIIVQDWGVLRIARQLCPAIPLHASTQMSVHTLRGAKELAALGVKRVVLARELSFHEIREISQNAGLETEVFVHGALCMSVSGQCYLSGMLGGRSGNRGNCAGSCRLPWKSVPKGQDGSPAPDGDYALSLKDNCLISHLSKLSAAGVTSLKVEGRMKRPEYVAASARAYSDALCGGNPDLETLRAVFSRSGFTDGYLTGKIDENLFGFRQKGDVTAATPKILKSLFNTYQKEAGKIPLDLTLIVRRKESVKLTAQDCDGNTAETEGGFPEEAISKPSTEEALCRSLAKLGGTIFLPREIHAEIDDGLLLPVSALNELRRSVCAKIQALREAVTPLPFHEQTPASPEKTNGVPANAAVFCHTARFERYDQIPFEDIPLFQSFSLPLREVMTHADKLKQYSDCLLIEPDRAMFSYENEIVRMLADLKAESFCHLLCNNIAHLHLAKELGMEAHGGPFLNCTNSYAAALLAELGLRDITLSFELDLRDAKKISSPVPTGLLIYGYLPLMLLRSCPARASSGCKACTGNSLLTDRLGMRFRLLCRDKRYTELLNANVLWMGDRLSELAGLSFGTFYFTFESREVCHRVLSRYRTGESTDEKFTRGLYYRTV